MVYCPVIGLIDMNILKAVKLARLHTGIYISLKQRQFHTAKQLDISTFDSL